MHIYIVLLRGINVGGQKKIKMAELRAHLAQWGFLGAQTYIQSGNIVLQSPDSARAVAQRIKEGIQSTYGFDVPTLVLPVQDFTAIFRANPYQNLTDIKEKRVYFVLFYQYPEKERIVAFGSEEYESEEFSIRGKCLYLLCKGGMGKAKLNNNLVERKLKITATARNYRTMQKLIEMAGKVAP